MITFQYLSYGSKDLFDQDDTDQTLEPIIPKLYCKNALYLLKMKGAILDRWSTRNELNCFDQIVVDFV